jgi:hypothetical protein
MDIRTVSGHETIQEFFRRYVGLDSDHPGETCRKMLALIGVLEAFDAPKQVWGFVSHYAVSLGSQMIRQVDGRVRDNRRR